MCAISTFSCEQVKPLNFRPPCCWLGLGTLSMRRSLVAPLSGTAQCDIVIAIYRISLSFAGNELGNDPTARKQLRWRRRLDLICTSGQRRTNILVARTYARWPLRASGVLDPLARRVKKAAGPADQRSMSRPAILNHFSATFLSCLFSRNTDFPGSWKRSSKTFQSYFSPITKHFVSRNTLHNLKLHNLRIIMEYTSHKLNGCIISKTKSIKLPNR